MMNSSNTCSAPQPINPRRTSATSTSDHGSYFDSPAMMEGKRRTDSYSSDVSILDSAPASPPKSSHSFIKPTATVNRYTTCGRHTDQLLFGGPSLAELARSLIKRH